MQKFELNHFQDLQPGYIIVDARKPETFAEGYIEGSISIPFDENFLSSLNELVDSDQKILLVADESDLPELIKILRSSTLSNVAGYLNGGFDAWRNAGNKTDLIIAIEADEFAMDYKFDEFFLLDVRSKEEFEKEHVDDAEHIALVDLESVFPEMDVELSYYVYGASKADAITGGSLLRRNGFDRVRAIAADYETIKAAGVPVIIRKKKESGSK